MREKDKTLKGDIGRACGALGIEVMEMGDADMVPEVSDPVKNFDRKPWWPRMGVVDGKSDRPRCYDGKRCVITLRHHPTPWPVAKCPRWLGRGFALRVWIRGIRSSRAAIIKSWAIPEQTGVFYGEMLRPRTTLWR